MKRLALGLILACLMAGLAAAGLAWREIVRPGPQENRVTILISTGSGPGRIARTLDEAGAIRHELLFKASARILGLDRKLKAGEYAIDPRRSIREILKMLEEGRTVLRRVTLSEGLTSRQIVEALEQTEGLAGAASHIPDEGALLPETYYFSYGDSVDLILGRMRAAQAELLDALWPERAEDLPFGSREEAIVLASIIEKETGRDDERDLVASVFINRLKRGMRLQSDPTVIYGLTGGEPLGRPIRQSELDAATAFNTYSIKGLPPQPIANPGRAAILAALNPARSDYLYFVADGAGGHAFAATHEAHVSNVKAWRRRMREAIPSPEPGAKSSH